VGPKTAEHLAGLGVTTLGELAALDDVTAAALLGSHGPGLVARASGVDEREVHDNEAVKSVSNERTFSTDVRLPAEVDGALAALCAKVGRRLRHKRLAGRTVTVKLRFADFTTRTVQRTLPEAADDEAVFGPVARELVSSAWSPGVGLRLLGIGVSGFDERAAQLPLFAGEVPDATEDTPRDADERARLVRGIDAVREKFGDSAVRYGRELKAPGRAIREGATDEARSRPRQD